MSFPSEERRGEWAAEKKASIKIRTVKSEKHFLHLAFIWRFRKKQY